MASTTCEDIVVSFDLKEATTASMSKDEKSGNSDEAKHHPTSPYLTKFEYLILQSKIAYALFLKSGGIFKKDMRPFFTQADTILKYSTKQPAGSPAPGLGPQLRCIATMTRTAPDDTTYTIPLSELLYNPLCA